MGQSIKQEAIIMKIIRMAEKIINLKLLMCRLTQVILI